MARIAFYTGSFDPVTNGHADVIAAAAGLCDRLVLAIGVHPGKTPLLSVEQRAELLRAVAGPLLAAKGAALDVVTFDDLAVSRYPVSRPDDDYVADGETFGLNLDRLAAAFDQGRPWN